MPDEAGSLDCRVVIDAKRSLEDVLRLLSDLPIPTIFADRY